MKEYPSKKGTKGNTSSDVASLNVGVVEPTEKEKFLKETREFWENRTGQPLTDEDAREIIANVTGFFKVIAKWDSKAKEKK